MDLGLPGASGIAATAGVRQASPDTRVLVLTADNDVVYLRRAFAAGASGYLLKEAADIDLVQAVRTVASGRQYVHPTLGAAALHMGADADRPAGPGGQLSERELEVLRGIARGHTNAEIAAALHASVRTIETRRAHIQQKLGTCTRGELVERARSAHLLVDDQPSVTPIAPRAAIPRATRPTPCRSARIRARATPLGACAITDRSARPRAHDRHKLPAAQNRRSDPEGRRNGPHVM